MLRIPDLSVAWLAAVFKVSIYMWPLAMSDHRCVPPTHKETEWTCM